MSVYVTADQSVPYPDEAPASAPKWSDRAKSLLYSPAAPFVLAGLALLLSLPSLGLGVQLDDRTYRRLFAEGRNPLDLLHETEAALAHAKQLGVFSWWSGSEFTIYFLRPLSALSHQLEFALWPDAIWLMHGTNCALYALLVLIATLLYRELSPSDPRLAGLAALMFAVNESHAQVVGWVTSRHVMLSSLFALLAVLLHVRSRARRSPTLLLASALCTALALLSGELGVIALGYIVAYALAFESGALRSRLISTAPHVLIGAAWLAVYAALGCGVHDAGWYRDPIQRPFYTLLQGLVDSPLWLLSALGGDCANLGLVMPQTLARVLAVLLLAPLAWLIVPVLGSSRLARFYALGTLLSCAVLFATVPQDRMLMVMSFGGFGWLACFFVSVGEHSSLLLRSSAAGLSFPHLVMAPLGFIPLLGGALGVDASAQALAEAVPRAGVTQAVAVNLPLELLTNAAWSIRDASTTPLHQLYAGFSELSAERIDAKTLELSVEDGWCTRPFERLFTTPSSLPKLGETRSAEGMRATVVEVSADGLPKRVRFQFEDGLESASRVWLAWDGRRPVRWTPPAPGKRVEVPSASRLSLLF